MIMGVCPHNHSRVHITTAIVSMSLDFVHDFEVKNVHIVSVYNIKTASSEHVPNRSSIITKKQQKNMKEDKTRA